MPKVKVKIAVAVDSDGNWYAAGESGSRPEIEMIIDARTGVLDDAAVYWIEAELDIPEERIIQAKVTPA